jgi:hypothetical protein
VKIRTRETPAKKKGSSNSRKLNNNNKKLEKGLKRFKKSIFVDNVIL